MSTFVSVGNATQPFGRLLKAVFQQAPNLPQPVFIQYGHNVFCEEGCQGMDFMGMEEFKVRLQEAELLIFHAGAGSVIHAIRSCKVPVVMPRLAELGEHVDDHQLEFARALSEAGKVVIAMNASELSDAAARAMALQRNIKTAESSVRLIELVRQTLKGYEDS